MCSLASTSLRISSSRCFGSKTGKQVEQGMVLRGEGARLQGNIYLSNYGLTEQAQQGAGLLTPGRSPAPWRMPAQR